MSEKSPQEIKESIAKRIWQEEREWGSDSKKSKTYEEADKKAQQICEDALDKNKYK